MSAAGSDLVVVYLNVSPGLEEALIDWLLGREGERGFSSTAIYGHSSRHDGLSVAEQVRGHRRRTQFEVHMRLAALAGFLADADREFGSADVHCVVVPALAAGSLASVCKAFEA